jgi:hypothetical protein
MLKGLVWNKGDEALPQQMSICYNGTTLCQAAFHLHTSTGTTLCQAAFLQVSLSDTGQAWGNQVFGKVVREQGTNTCC